MTELSRNTGISGSRVRGVVKGRKNSLRVCASVDRPGIESFKSLEEVVGFLLLDGWTFIFF